MDFKVFLATFLSVFVAELGDKTQLLTFGASASTHARLSVFAGAALALVAACAVGVLAGGLLGKFVSPLALERIGGLIFLVMGVVLLWKSF